MQFKVPQFLDIEDKIFGPFTFKQFVYLVGGAGMCFILYRAMGLILAIIPIAIIAAFSLALTFYKPNNKPFINMLEAGFKFYIQDKLYIWKRRKVKKEVLDKEKIPVDLPPIGKTLGASKLRDLAWSLDVLDLKKQEENTGN